MFRLEAPPGAPYLCPPQRGERPLQGNGMQVHRMEKESSCGVVERALVTLRPVSAFVKWGQ